MPTIALLARGQEEQRSYFRAMLEQGASVDDAFVILDTDVDLPDAWAEVSMLPSAFAAFVALVSGSDCGVCGDCHEPRWADDLATTPYGPVCEPCLDSYYRCDRCEDHVHADDTCSVGDDIACEHCANNHSSYCEDCDCSYWDNESDYHDHEEEGCECEAPRQHFTFPANGAGTVDNDERLAVELAAGVISEEGVRVIHRAVVDSLTTGEVPGWTIGAAILELDPTWQKKDGNYTRRLSKALHKLGVKVPATLLSEVGNLARQHTSDSATFQVEFTRDLNLSASAFGHEDSCWWQSYYSSRCALKQWGGIGFRSYGSEDDYSNDPSGRVWVQPLGADMLPTADATGAHAYVVYNGYGDLSGYAAARIVAYLTGKTYRKVSLHLGDQYVNSKTGYLVAGEATCNAHDDISIDRDSHHVPEA